MATDDVGLLLGTLDLLVLKTLSWGPRHGYAVARGCLYWVHTHTPDGIIHIEAPQARTFTLGDFFHIWGQPLGKTVAASAHAPNGSTLHVWVNGKAYVGDPSSIPLNAHTDITIEAGPPFPLPKPYASWGTL